MKVSRLLPILLVLILTLSLQSCATIFGGRTNSVKFHTESSPTANVFLDGEKIGTAPGKIKLKKGKIQHGSILEIKAEGYETQKYMIFLKMHPWYTVGNMATLFVGLAVDHATGDIYRPKPRSFSYTLEKQN